MVRFPSRPNSPPTAIAKARGWIDDIQLGRIASFSEIAKRQAQGERHIRLLAPLAFVSPRIIAARCGGRDLAARCAIDAAVYDLRMEISQAATKLADERGERRSISRADAA